MLPHSKTSLGGSLMTVALQYASCGLFKTLNATHSLPLANPNHLSTN